MRNGYGSNLAKEKFEALAEDKLGSAEEKFEALAEEKAGPAEEKYGVIAEEIKGPADGDLDAPAKLDELPPLPPLPDGDELNGRFFRADGMWLNELCLPHLPHLPHLPPLPPSPEERVEGRRAAQEEEGYEEDDEQRDEASVRQLLISGLLRKVIARLPHAWAEGSGAGIEEALTSEEESPGPSGLGCG